MVYNPFYNNKDSIIVPRREYRFEIKEASLPREDKILALFERYKTIIRSQ
jgi:hypothetical protein